MRKARSLEEFVSWFGVQKLSTVKLEGRFFLCSKKLREAQLSCDGLRACGLLLGQMNGEFFSPSFGLLQYLKGCSVGEVVVNGYGEIDFLYGKDVRKRHVVSVSGPSSKDEAKLVVNGFGDVLGYGFLVGDSSSKVLANALDRGILLKWDVGKAKKKR